MSYRVPFVNARAHYARLKPELDQALIGCLTDGDLLLRQQLRDSEARQPVWEHLGLCLGTPRLPEIVRSAALMMCTGLTRDRDSSATEKW